MPSGTKTQAQAEKTQAMHTIEDMYRRKQVNQATISEYKNAGVITEHDLFRAKIDAGTDPLVRAVRELHPEQALNVYLAATPAEQKELRTVIEAKENKISTEVPRDQQSDLRKAFHNALHPAPQFKAGVV